MVKGDDRSSLSRGRCSCRRQARAPATRGLERLRGDGGGRVRGGDDGRGLKISEHRHREHGASRVVVELVRPLTPREREKGRWRSAGLVSSSRGDGRVIEQEAVIRVRGACRQVEAG